MYGSLNINLVVCSIFDQWYVVQPIRILAVETGLGWRIVADKRNRKKEKENDRKKNEYDISFDSALAIKTSTNLEWCRRIPLLGHYYYTVLACLYFGDVGIKLLGRPFPRSPIIILICTNWLRNAVGGGFSTYLHIKPRYDMKFIPRYSLPFR